MRASDAKRRTSRRTVSARKSMDVGVGGSKRRRSLALPGPAKCMEIRQLLHLSFASECEEQPIGRRLFHSFCNSVAEYSRAFAFLDQLVELELAEDNMQNALLRKIVANFLQPDSENFLSFLSDAMTSAASGASAVDMKELVPRAQQETRQFLMGKPFREYLESPFFQRFLQWKALEQQKITEKHFCEFRVLGKGGFGEVCAIQVKLTGKMHACKKLNKKSLKKKKGQKMALLEKEILESVNSSMVVRLAYAFETKEHLCLVMTLMNGGDLKFHIYNVGKRGLSMERVLFYTAQITCGLHHLHGLSIIYRDMKPENVLLDERGNCRLSDLGLAVVLRNADDKITQRAGTNGYMSPEVIKQEPYSYDADWFALGCTIHEMILGYTPFKNFQEQVSKEELRRRVLQDKVVFTKTAFTDEAKDLCTQLLAKRACDRLGSRNPNDDPRRHGFFRSINFQRLEARLVSPPFVPDPDVVYAKDLCDIDEFSEVKGVELDEEDLKFHKDFATGCVPLTWQEEIIESGLFDDVESMQHRASLPGNSERRSGVCLIL
uniref:G protein-coupled receptor kinase n=1 Tax=Eptatretus burgeri TaxID=7764 RepID=A0A8C4N564_EPTBU